MNIPFFNYKITNQSNRLDVYIDGTIVDSASQAIMKEWFNDQTSVSFKSFRQEIMDSGLRDISITINSMGGQIGDAMAMHDFIQNLETEGYNIETIGIGMVCSASTYILSASKNSKISKNAYYMIHNISGGVMGNVNEIEAYAVLMRNFNNKVRDYYSGLTGKTADQVSAWMDAETWFYGQEVVDNGFVKSLISDQAPKTPINQSDFTFKNKNALSVYNSAVKIPENLDENFNIKDMNKFVEAIVNAFKTSNLVVTETNATATPLTIENLTNAMNLALADFTPEVPVENVSNAVNTFFKDGLPTNILNQITEALKPAVVNISEDQSVIEIAKRLDDIETKISNNVGGAKARGTKGNEVVDKYEDAGIGWSEK